MLAILIPYYNEDRMTLLSTLDGIDATLEEHAVVCIVDDGSENPLSFQESEIPGRWKNLSVFRLRHLINLGQGAALQTAMEFAREGLCADLFVTMDSDGQHDPRDLRPLLEPLQKGEADIVFGSRFLGVAAERMPESRRRLIRLATFFERWITGLPLSDAHNGFRAFNKETASVLDLRHNRMAHATEFKQQVASKGLRYREVPVRVRYSAETLEKGQRNLGSLTILKDLLKTYLLER